VQIHAPHFGLIKIEDEKLVSFPKGVIGFTQAKKFCLLSLPTVKPYEWLQCVDVPELAFLVVPVIVLRPDYQLQLNGDEEELLNFAAGQSPLVLAIMTMSGSAQDATANFLAPLVINDELKIGCQVINEQGGYKTRHLLKDELRKFATEGQDHAGADQKKEPIADARK
jgi:flagellar assembly factor FliW